MRSGGASSSRRWRSSAGQEKIAYMAAHAFRDGGDHDAVRLVHRPWLRGLHARDRDAEVWSTDALWQIVNDTMQNLRRAGLLQHRADRADDARRAHQHDRRGSQRRAARIHRGGRHQAGGEASKGVLEASRHPLREWTTLWRFGRSQLAARLTMPDIPIRTRRLKSRQRHLARDVRDFGLTIQSTLGRLRKEALRKHVGPVKDEEMVILRSSTSGNTCRSASPTRPANCTRRPAPSRLDHLLTSSNGNPDARATFQAGRYYMQISHRRFRQCLAP